MNGGRINYTVGFNSDTSGLNQIRSELQSLSNLNLPKLQVIDKKATEEDLNSIKQAAAKLGEAFESAYNPKLGTVNIEKFNNELKKGTMTIPQMEAAFAKMGAQGTQSFRNMTAEILTTQREVKQTNKFLDSMTQTLGNTIKWSIASNAINMFTSSIRNAWNYSIKLDTSLNDIRIVTDKSAQDMEKFAKSANRAASSLGASTTAYTKASLIYFQQGLGDEDVEARTQATVKAANVTGQSAAEVSEQLTAVWNGYKVVAEDAERYVDKLAAVAATTAADLEELSEGMSKVASAANTMGVDIDQLSAQISTIVSVTRQDAAAVGTALKTIFARMGDLKVDGVDEFGTSLGDVSGQMKQMGVDVLDQQGNLRDMGEVIEEVAAKWGTWTDAQRQAAAVAMAGKRQYNNLIALFDNWDMYESALTTSQNSEGTLQKQQDTYMESTRAHLDQLATAGERVYDAIFDNDSMNDAIDAITTLVQGVGNFIEAIGGGGNLLLGLGSIAVRVFSKDIAGGLTRTLHNFGLLKEYQRQYQAELEITSKYQGVNDEAIQKMVALKEKELKHSKLLTEEQRQQFELYIKETAELANQQDAFEEKIKKAKEYADYIVSDQENAETMSSEEKQKILKNQITYLEGDKEIKAPGVIEGFKSTNKEYKAESLVAQNENVIKAYEDFGSLDDIDENQDALSAYGETNQSPEKIQEIIEAYKMLKEETDSFTDSLDELIENTYVDQESKEELIKIIEKLSKKEISLTKAKSEAYKITQKNIKQAKESKEALKNEEAERNRLNKKIKDGENAQKSFLKSVNTQALIAGTTKAIGALGQMFSAIKALQNIGSIINDETLSDGEKFLQFNMAVIPAVLMLISSYKQLKGNILDVIVALGKKGAAMVVERALIGLTSEDEKKAALIKLINAEATEEEKEELMKKSVADLQAAATEKVHTSSKKAGILATIQQTLANYGLQLSMWQIMLIMLAIMAAILILIALISAISNLLAAMADDGKKAFEDASKAAQSATEEFNKTKEAFEELKKSFEDYNNAQKAIEDMTVGTEEWRQAIQEANMQVLELLDKYPELAQYIDNINGQLKISDAGQEAVLDLAEDRVVRAQRTMLTANARKLEAKNSMIAQQGSTEYLSNVLRDNGEGYVSEGARDKAYQAAIDIVNSKGNAILAGSFEDFEKALREQGVYEDGLIAALWENKEAVAKNALEVAANTKAIDLQKQQAAASYLENSNIYQSSDNKDAITKLIAQQAGEDSQAYKDAYQEYYTDKGIDNVAKRYAEENGIDYVSYKEEDGNIKYTLADGSERIINEKAMASSIAQEEAYKAIASETNLDELEKQLNRVTKAAEGAEGSAKGMGKAFGGMVAGEVADFSKATEKELQGLQDALTEAEKSVKDTGEKGFDEEVAKLDNKEGAIAEYLGFQDAEELDKYAKSMGYESGEAYTEAVEQGIKNYNIELSKIGLDLPQEVREQFEALKNNKDIFSGFTLSAKKALSEGMKNAYENAGIEGVKAFKTIIENNSLESYEVERLSKALEKVDWSSSGAIQDLEKELENLGITLDETTVGYNDLIEAMKNSRNIVGDIVNNFSSLRSELSDVLSVLSELSLGKVISDEDYKKIIDYNSALERFFIMTVDGYQFIGGSGYEEELANTKQKNFSVTSIADSFATTTSAANTLINGDTIYELDQETNTVGLKKGTTQEQIRSYLSHGNYSSVVKAAGFNQENYKNYISEIQSGVSDEFANGVKYKLSTLAKVGSPAVLAKAAKKGLTDEQLLGLDSNKNGIIEADEGNTGDLKDLSITSDEHTLAQNILAAAKTRYSTAEDYIANTESGVLNVLNQVQSGEFEKQNKNAQAVALMAQAGTYSELGAIVEKTGNIDQEVINQASRGLLAQEAEEFGIQSSAWEAYTKQVGENNFTIQAEYLKTLAKIDLYDQVNAYAAIDAEVENLTNDIEKLQDEQDRLVGKKLLDSYKEIITKNNELYDKQKAKNNLLKEENILRKQGFAATESDLQNSGITVAYNEDGSVSNDTLNAILEKTKGLSVNDPLRETLMGYYNSFVDYNNKVITQINDEIEIEQENINNNLNAQIEKFNTAIELRLDLDELKKEWREFEREYVDKTFLFGDETSSDIFKAFAKDLQPALDRYNQRVAEVNDAFGGNFATYNGVTDYSALNEIQRESIDNVRESYEELFEVYSNLLEGYTKAQEEIVEIYDKQINRLANINELYQGSADLAKLLGKDVSDYYNNIAANSVNSYLLNVDKLTTLQNEYEKGLASGFSDPEVKATLEENMTAAANAVISSAQDAMSAIVDKFLESVKEKVNDVFKDSFGSSYDMLSTEWELASQLDDRYLDEVNRAYETQNIARQFQKAIDETDSVTAQNKLNKAMQEQLKLLKEKDKLTQNDIDRANAMYELTLKQIALEEARQTANKMKLTRDASGNYTYQYVADEDAIADAEAELAAAQNELYNINKDEAKERISEVFELAQEGQEKINELLLEGREEEARMVYEQYFGTNGLISGLGAEFSAIEESLKGIDLSFEGTSFGQLFENFAKFDFNSIGDAVGESFNSAIGDVGNLKTNLESLLGTESPLTNTVASLNEAYNNNANILNDEVNKVTTNTAGMLTSLVNGETLLKKLASELTGFVSKYTDNLEKQLNGSEVETAIDNLANSANRAANIFDLVTRQLDDDPSNDPTESDWAAILSQNKES